MMQERKIKHMKKIEKIIKIEEYRLLYKAMQSIDRQKREILTLQYFCGLTLNKISDNLGYSLRQIARLHKKALEVFIIL